MRSTPGEHDRRERLDRQAPGGVLDAGQDRRRGVVAGAVRVVRQGAEQAAQLAHAGRGRTVMADHVADDQHGRAVGLREAVVPVPADLGLMRSSPVARDDVQVVGLRCRVSSACWSSSASRRTCRVAVRSSRAAR
jgi:hypothetical protein